MGEKLLVCIAIIPTGSLERHYQHAVVDVGERRVEVSCGKMPVGCVDHMECEVARDWVLMAYPRSSTDGAE